MESLERKLTKIRNQKFQKDLIERKYKMLSEKVNLSKMLFDDFPELEYKNKLLDPRNKAVHKGYVSNYAEAYNSIEIATILADKFYSEIYD